MTGNRESFIRANTALHAPPHVPEIRLHLADEAHDLWLKTEEELGAIGLEPPFWAFAWAGGQGLARHLLDNPALVTGKTIIDIASGSGIVAIAAGLAGATHITANDVDEICAQVIALNAQANDVAITFAHGDMASDALLAHDVILAGDIFYDRAMASIMRNRFCELAASGKTVLIGDPGRAYLPKEEMVALARYHVPVTRALEDAEIRQTTVWQFVGRKKT